MASDGHNFMISKISEFEQPRNSFVPQIMPAEIGKLLFGHLVPEGVDDASMTPQLLEQFHDVDSSFVLSLQASSSDGLGKVGRAKCLIAANGRLRPGRMRALGAPSAGTFLRCERSWLRIA